MVRKATDPTNYAARTAGRGRSPGIESAWRVLEAIVDPEVPVVSIVELGMIADVREQAGRIVVDLTPTFAGCPALALIQDEIKTGLRAVGLDDVAIHVVYDPPWTTDRITQRGRRKLQEFGLAPPGDRCAGGSPNFEQIPCPFCGSINTELESIFGPTLCRSIHYCHACLQSFEHFKTV